VQDSDIVSKEVWYADKYYWSRSDTYYTYYPPFNKESNSNVTDDEARNNVRRLSMLPSAENISRNSLRSTSGTSDVVCSYPLPIEDYPAGMTEKQNSISISQYQSYYLRFRYYFWVYSFDRSNWFRQDNDNSGLWLNVCSDPGSCTDLDSSTGNFQLNFKGPLPLETGTYITDYIEFFYNGLLDTNEIENSLYFSLNICLDPDTSPGAQRNADPDDRLPFAVYSSMQDSTDENVFSLSHKAQPASTCGSNCKFKLSAFRLNMVNIRPRTTSNSYNSYISKMFTRWEAYEEPVASGTTYTPNPYTFIKWFPKSDASNIDSTTKTFVSTTGGGGTDYRIGM